MHASTCYMTPDLALHYSIFPFAAIFLPFARSQLDFSPWPMRTWVNSVRPYWLLNNRNRQSLELGPRHDLWHVLSYRRQPKRRSQLDKYKARRLYDWDIYWWKDIAIQWWVCDTYIRKWQCRDDNAPTGTLSFLPTNDRHVPQLHDHVDDDSKPE